MQQEITSPSPLLSPHGELVQVGWARQPYLNCNLEDLPRVAFPRRRGLWLKRWHYAAVVTPDYYFCAAVLHSAGWGLTFISTVDFRTGAVNEGMVSTPFDLGFRLAGNGTEAESHFDNRTTRVYLTWEGNSQRIRVEWPSYNQGQGFNCDLALLCAPELESLVIAVPVSEGRFYHGRKLYCLPVQGWIRRDPNQIRLQPTQCLGTLDWGCGCWEPEGAWARASASGLLPDGRTLGLNLSAGIIKPWVVSENAFLLDGHVHKLEEVSFDHERPSLTMPWTMRSSEGQLDLQFVPFMERVGQNHTAFSQSDMRQLFGRFSGSLRTAEGEEIRVCDLIGWVDAPPPDDEAAHKVTVLGSLEAAALGEPVTSADDLGFEAGFQLREFHVFMALFIPIGFGALALAEGAASLWHPLGLLLYLLLWAAAAEMALGLVSPVTYLPKDPGIEAQTGMSILVFLFYIVGFSQFCRSLDLAVGGFEAAESGYWYWLRFGVANVLEAILLDIPDIYEWGVTDIHAIAFWPRALLFVFRASLELYVVAGLLRAVTTARKRWKNPPPAKPTRASYFRLMSVNLGWLFLMTLWALPLSVSIEALIVGRFAWESVWATLGFAIPVSFGLWLVWQSGRALVPLQGRANRILALAGIGVGETIILARLGWLGYFSRLAVPLVSRHFCPATAVAILIVFLCLRGAAWLLRRLPKG